MGKRVYLKYLLINILCGIRVLATVLCNAPYGKLSFYYQIVAGPGAAVCMRYLIRVS